jgi:predicted TIM-barrel fold metal-dependent hydrolase
MGDLGIVHSVLLPIDFPALSDNAHNALLAAHDDDRLVPYGSVHPYASDVAGKLDAQAHRGALGVKMHPNVQCVHPSDPLARRLYRMCGERRMVVFWHCGPVGIEPALGRWLTQVRHYERAIADNPGVTFVLGHAGALQLDEAIDLCNRYPNVYLETSSQSLSGLRAMAARANPERIVYGSDWPFYHQAIPITKVLMATEHDLGLRSKILYRNAARLLGRD